MILFDLRCSQGHEFEAWFRDSDSYDRLAAAGEVHCSICGDDQVEKALMAPNVRTKKALPPPPAVTSSAGPGSAPESNGKAPADAKATEPKNKDVSVPVEATKTAMEPSGEGGGFPEKVVEMMTMVRKAQTFIEKNFDPVGNKFAEEARKIHYGEAEKRGIYGEATKDEAEALADEGIEVNQMPWLPSRDS